MMLFSLRARSASLLRLVGLALITWTVFGSSKHAPATSGRGLVVLIAWLIAAVAWLVWVFWSTRQRASVTADVWTMAICGGVIAAMEPSAAGSAFAFVAASSASVRGGMSRGLIAVMLSALALSVGAIVYGNSGLGVLAYSLGFVAIALAGTNLRQIHLRADQAELLLAQTQRSHEEQLKTARLEEQARIAREIHDVLAHSLAGLTIQLEATIALLDQGMDPETVRERVSKAHALAQDGLRETRRAVGALRGDQQVPVPLALRALVDDYRAETEAPVELTLTGDQTKLTGQIGETVLRVVQEAVTNVRKHAPGSGLDVTVAAAADQITVLIEDRAHAAVSAATTTSELASSGGGYGLTGMRERAALVGGSVEAGPFEYGWRVKLVIPAGGTA